MGVKFKRPSYPGQYPNSPIANMVGPIPDINTIYGDTVKCSYCGVDVNIHTATRGTSLQGVYVGIEGKKTHFQRNLVACPKCCLQIKPTIDKDGSIKRSNMKFPEGD